MSAQPSRHWLNVYNTDISRGQITVILLVEDHTFVLNYVA